MSTKDDTHKSRIAVRFAIVSCSLDRGSRSRAIARDVESLLAANGHISTFIDLRETPLPAFDSADCFQHPVSAWVHRVITESDGVFIAAPIYNWGLGSAAKNLIELTGATGQGRRAAWFDKVVTFLCAGGLPHSYMAYGPVALSLMLDFKCVINPYAVYATDRDFDASNGFSEAVRSRIAKTVSVKVELAGGLSGRTYRSDWEV